MTLMYDGHDFETLFIVGDPEISILNYQPKTVESDSKNGSAVIGKTWGNSTVAFTLVVEGSASERRDKLSTLGAWLDVDEPKPLVLPDTPDRYYMAVPSGTLELNRGIGAEYAQLTFAITEPASYGEEHSILFYTWDTESKFNVNGTFPTYPIIETGQVVPENGVWGMRLDNGDYIRVPISATVNSLVIDCEARTVLINGNAAIPTLDSDWLKFEPGEHTLIIDEGMIGNVGSKPIVKWRERWL